MSLIELYNKVKGLKDVDMMIVDAYFSTILKEVGFSSVDELVEAVNKNADEMKAIHSHSSEINYKIYQIDQELIKVNSKQFELMKKNSRKSSLILLALLALLGLNTCLLVVLFNIPACLFAVVLLVFGSKYAWKQKAKVWKEYNENQEYIDEKESELIVLNNEFTSNLANLMSLNNIGNDYKKYMDTINEFLLTCVRIHGQNEEQTQEVVEEVAMEEEVNEEVTKTL